MCVLFAFFGNTPIGESFGNWYAQLEKPWFLVPLWAFSIVGAVYYLLFATVLSRILFTLTTAEEELLHCC
jgi:tryptophan-rich sensory protein